MTASCSTCPFWQFEDNDREDHGGCHRSAPQPGNFNVGIRPFAQAPLTHKDFWCGEHPDIQDALKKGELRRKDDGPRE